MSNTVREWQEYEDTTPIASKTGTHGESVYAHGSRDRHPDGRPQENLAAHDQEARHRAVVLNLKREVRIWLIPEMSRD